MSDWTSTRLGDLLRPSNERSSRNDQFPVLTSSRSGLHLQSEYFNRVVASKDNTGYKVIRKGQFTYRAMSDDGFFRFNRLSEQEAGIISPAYEVFECETQKADPIFMDYLLNSGIVLSQIYGAAQGGTRLSLRLSTLSEFDAEIPPLPEQKKIAEILSGIDSDISALVESISRTRLSKEALLRNILAHPSYDYQKTSTEGWTYCRLEDVCSLITYGFTNPMPTTPSGVYMVTAKDVRDGRIDKETARFTSHEAYNTLLTDKSRPVSNDILVTKDGTLGRTAIVRNEVVCINQSVALLRPQKDESAEYLHLLLGSPQYQQTMLDQAGGSAVKHIYITTLAKMDIALPSSYDQMQRIVQFFASFDDALIVMQRKLVALQNLRIGLASDLLSGRKRVSV